MYKTHRICNYNQEKFAFNFAVYVNKLVNASVDY